MRQLFYSDDPIDNFQSICLTQLCTGKIIRSDFFLNDHYI